MSKILERVKELLTSAQKLETENTTLVEVTNKQIERIEKARQNMMETANKRQQEILSGLTSRKGAIFELLKLELGDDAKPEAIEAKALELQKELQADAMAKAASASKEEAVNPAPLAMVKKPTEEKTDLPN